MWPPSSVLFVELLGGLGDVVIALPAIHALARSHPQASVTVLTFAPGHELLEPDPLVAEVVALERGRDDAVSAVAALLASRRFDLAVSDARYSGLPELIESTVPHAVTNLWRFPPDDELIQERFLALLAADRMIARELALPEPRLVVDDGDRAWADAWLAERLPDVRPRVLLVPEAGMTIKRWALEHWVALGRRLVEAQAGVVVAAGGEPDLADAVVDGIAGVREVSVGPAVLLARGPLRRAAALAAAADVCVAADTGLARVAAATATPTLALFGPTWAGRFGLGGGHESLQSPFSCPERRPANMTEQRCWYSGRCVFEGKRTCMDDLSVDLVLERVRALLAPAAV